MEEHLMRIRSAKSKANIYSVYTKSLEKILMASKNRRCIVEALQYLRRRLLEVGFGNCEQSCFCDKLLGGSERLLHGLRRRKLKFKPLAEAPG